MAETSVLEKKATAATRSGAYNFIGGKWEKGSGGTIENRNPATGELIEVFPASTAKDVERAVAAAAKAFQRWRKVPVVQRGRILYKAMEILVAHKEEYAALETMEMGKVLKETRGDVQEAIDTAFYFAGEGQRFFGQTSTSELADKFAMTIRRPIGVAGLVAPWNFPMAIPAWKCFPALLCGNAVVLKPAEDTPFSSVRLMEAFEEAGMPAGVVNLVCGLGPDAGQPLVEHPDVSVVSFTGSSAVGSKIGEICGRLNRKLCLEMGGKNAQLVMDDADLDLAVEGALWGGFGTTGQRCTATSRVILHAKIYDDFMQRFLERAKKVRVGYGLDESMEMGPLINQKALDKVERYVEIGRDEDKAKLLLGGQRLSGKGCDKGFFFAPTVFEGAPGMRIATEEIFGPVVTVLKADSFERGLEILNGTAYGLSGSVYTKDIQRMMRAIEDVDTGITYFNAPTIGAECHMPFGGVKQTGNGHRESGLWALDIFSEWKAVYIDYSGRLQKAQIDE